jgi:hypothetical protein
MMDGRVRVDVDLVRLLATGVIALTSACRDDGARHLTTVAAGSSVPTDASPPAIIGGAASCAGDCQPFLIAKLPTNRGTSIALDAAGFAYIATFYDDAIYRVRLEPDATPVLLYHSPGANLGRVEVHGDTLRWSSNAAGQIYSAPISGAGPITTIADALPGIWGFASDEQWIYWADFGGSAPGTIWKRPLAGGPSVAIARDGTSQIAAQVMIAGEQLLFTDQSTRMLRAPAVGGPTETWIDVAGDVLLQGFAADATHIYAATLADGRVLRIDKGTRAIDVVATDPASPVDVALDATNIYWVDYNPVEVWGRHR